MLQTIGVIALALWALVTDPHAQVHNIDRFPPVSGRCTAYRYIIEFTLPGEWCWFDAFHVTRCGVAIHDAPHECDPGTFK